MKDNKLKKILNNLYSSKIVNMNIDILNNSINMEVEILESGTSSKHSIEFHEVSAFYFVNNTGERRKNIIIPEKDDILELISIDLIDEDLNIRIRSKEEWVKQYYSKANIFLEICNRVLFVETKKIYINSGVYEL